LNDNNSSAARHEDAGIEVAEHATQHRGEGSWIFAYLAGEVKLNGLNANVLRTGRHDDRLGGRYRLVGEEEEEDKEKRWEDKLRERKRMWR